jgi:hypothetical protein
MDLTPGGRPRDPSPHRGWRFIVLQFPSDGLRHARNSALTLFPKFLVGGYVEVPTREPELSDAGELFVPESAHGIDPGRAARRKIAGEQCQHDDE